MSRRFGDTGESLEAKVAHAFSNSAAFWRRYKRNRAAVLGLILVCAFVLLAILAPIISPFDPLDINVGTPFQPPDRKYLMGTSHNGRDIFSGVIHGSRVSLLVGFMAAFTSTVIGIVLGAISGYYGGKIEELLMRITELFQVIPQFFLALVMVALFGTGVWRMIFVIGILSWPVTARLVRSEFLSLRERQFVDALKLLTAGDARIIFTEILPNAFVPIMVNGSLQVARAILLESSLSFLGLGDLNVASWGVMLSDAQSFLRSAWWMSVFPGLAIFLLTLGLNLFGDGLNEALNPRLRER